MTERSVGGGDGHPADDVLDESFETDLAGEARDLRDTSSGAVFAFVFALALIYFVLAAQFESFLHPFIILLALPLSVAYSAS